MPPKWVFLILFSIWLIGLLYLGYVVPNFIKLKIYRATSGKTEREENTVAVKCTIWSAFSSMLWVLGFPLPLSFIALDSLLPPAKDGGNIALIAWPMCLSALVFLAFLLVLVGHQAVFDDYGMTIRKCIWGKPVFVPWNRINTVDYDFFRGGGNSGGSGFHFSYSQEKDTREDHILINFAQENYIKGLEYAVKRISERKFDESARKKLKKMGISLSSQIITAPTSKSRTDVRKINANTFPDRAKLTSVTIPDGIKIIEAGAFKDCENLKSVTIPGSVTEIEEDAFNGCVNLTSITFQDGVELIGESAFFGCKSLTTVTIPATVTSIGLWAFDGCSSLTSINVAVDNADYCSVDGVLFNKDKSVLIQYPDGKSGAYIVVPDSVTKIEEDAFSDCVGIFSIEISNNVTEIGENAFADCDELKFVTIPDSVTFIGDYAFSGCDSLTLVKISGNVTSIGKGAFWCDALKSIHVAADNANYSGSSDGVLFNKTQDTLIRYPAGKSGAYTIPDSVTKIEDLAFADCVSLTSVEIPNSVTEIGEYAFSDCKSLKSVTIPHNVKSIKPNAFNGCVGLTSVIVQKRSIPPKISTDTFSGVTLRNVCLYVPTNSIAAYRHTKVWKDFDCIKSG